MNEPLDPARVRELLRKILTSGETRYSSHALDEMKKDKLTAVDAVNVLRGGVVEPGEFERGTWRYRVRTNQMTFVVAFRSERHLVVVTGWREKR